MTDETNALADLVSYLPGGGEARPGQADMARRVAGAIAAGRHLVVRAGTGTGKSLAYLVPVALADRRVVVATASRALQDQLGAADLPFVARHLGPVLARPLRFAVLKGRANYLCRQRADEITGGLDQSELDLADDRGALATELRLLLGWAESTPTGDRAELATEPSPVAWSALSVSGDECPGATRCPRGEDCFAEAARHVANQADVVVVNLALYGVHLGSGEHVLPDHDVVVIDECHQLEDALSSTLGFELGVRRLANLAARARRVIADPNLAGSVVDAGALLAAALADHRDIRLPRPLPPELADALVLVRHRIDALASALRAVKTSVADADQRRVRAQRVVQAVTDEIDIVIDLPRNYVAWVPTEGEPRLAVAPIEIGPMLSAMVWGQRTGVLTSATVPPGFARRVGLVPGGYDEADVGSPFDYQRHGLLYCAMHLPDPRHDSYRSAVHDELAALITAAEGRTLALFTSWRAVRAAVEALRPRLAVRVLAHGEQPVGRLVEEFRRDEATCLFATTGLFQGIDVPGATLSLVTIDRLPFPRPDDPLLSARRELVGPGAFAAIDVPRAATMLAQAAGRLIRSATDKGVVAVFDPRLGTARYRWDIVGALPPFRRTRHRAEVESFLRSLHQTSPAEPSP